MHANADLTATRVAAPDRTTGVRLHPDDPTVRVGALVGVFLLALWCLLWRLDRVDWHFDEVNYARDAWEAIHLRPHTNDHPLVGKYIIGLSQVLFGRDIVGVRMLPVLCSLAATGLVFALGRRIAGWWAGIAGAALWAVLPREFEVGGTVIGLLRADRYALLDTIVPLFALGALLAGLWWAERPSFPRAAVTGALVGLAIGTKATAITFVPAIAVLVLVAVRPLGRALVQGVVAGLSAVAVLVASYLPFGGDGWTMFQAMIDYQTYHVQIRHVTALGGDVYLREPWWANIAFWFAGQGPGLILALLVGAVAALWARNRLAVIYVWIALLVPMAVLSASYVALAHYWVAWFGPLVVLTGVGVVTMLRRPGLARVGGLAVILVFAVSGAVSLVRAGTVPTGDYQRMAQAVRDEAVAPTSAVVLGTSLEPYFPGVPDIFAAFAPDDFTTDLVVIERRLAEQSSPTDLVRLRDRARALGLQPAVIGTIEYWYREA